MNLTLLKVYLFAAKKSGIHYFDILKNVPYFTYFDILKNVPYLPRSG